MYICGLMCALLEVDGNGTLIVIIQNEFLLVTFFPCANLPSLQMHKTFSKKVPRLVPPQYHKAE